jgi:hypothetical protein
MDRLQLGLERGWGRPALRIRDDGTFPPDTIRDSVLNSFNNRITDMIGRWSTLMGQIGLRGRLVRVTSGANIIAHYSTIGNPTGLTMVTHQWGSACVEHRTANVPIDYVDVYIGVRSDWFTQDDSRRALWEGCPYNGGPAYTCSKKHDFASTFVHELGHAIGSLVHPSVIDAHSGNMNATNIAQCKRVDFRGDPLWRATMCASNSVTGSLADNEYRTERRTLDSWDRESFIQQHQRH